MQTKQSNIEVVVLCLLLLMFFLRIWGFGIVHTDDAVWALNAWQGNWRIIWDWATNQGRIWALVSGVPMFYTLKLQGSLAGELLRLGSFALFFSAFYFVATLYFGRRIAILAALLNLGFFAMRWEGSLITAYPAFAWALSALFLASVWAGRRYRETQKTFYLLAALGGFFISLFQHEGMTVLFMGLFLASALANHELMSHREIGFAEIINTTPSRSLIAGSLGVLLAYVLLYFIWRLAFPSHYDGHVLGSLLPRRVLPVLIDFSTSGSVLHDLFRPYSVKFSDPFAGDVFTVNYSLDSFLQTAIRSPLALVSGILVFVALFSVLKIPETSAAQKPPTGTQKMLSAQLVGLSIALVPILPVALTHKYQTWYFELGVHSNVHTAFSHFGVTLMLAALLGEITPRFYQDNRFGKVAALSIATAVSGISLVGYRMNDAIARDMSVEASRWRVLGSTLEISKHLGDKGPVLFSPRFSSGSWFAVVDESYWSKFAKARYNADIRLKSHSLSPQDVADGASFLDFYNSFESRGLVFFLGRLRLNDVNENLLVADRIAVFIENADASDRGQYFLIFRDVNRGPMSVRFGDLESVGDRADLRQVQNVAAEPGSIRIVRQSEIGALPLACSSMVSIGKVVWFGTRSPPSSKVCLGNSFLASGWNPSEKGGTWTSSPVAKIVLPTQGLPHGNLTLVLDVLSFTGLGFYDSSQTITISIGNGVIGKRIDNYRSSSMEPIKLVIPYRMWIAGKPLELSIQVDRTFNPSKLGISPDTRDIGVHVRSLEIASVRP